MSCLIAITTTPTRAVNFDMELGRIGTASRTVWTSTNVIQLTMDVVEIDVAWESMHRCISLAGDRERLARVTAHDEDFVYI